MRQSTDSRARGAQLILEHNREELRAVFAASPPRVGREFPRSATFRWMASHLNARALAATALAALMARPTLLVQLLGGWRRKA
jgi:hypothetical protein